MEYPRFIRELVGAWLEGVEERNRKKEEEKKKREENERKQVIIDWMVDRLVDSVIHGWYLYTKQADPKLDTREGVKQHVRWWSSRRKEDEFFRNNYSYYNMYTIGLELHKEFAAKFPEAPSCRVFLRSNYTAIWEAVREKMSKEIF